MAETVAEIKTPLTVSFQEDKRGPQGNIAFPLLQDWQFNTNDSIKYYLGTAWYKNLFKAFKAANGERIYLDLGAVKNMASIKINGQFVEGLWTAPWQIDITDFIKEENNFVEVEVVNL